MSEIILAIVDATLLVWPSREAAKSRSFIMLKPQQHWTMWRAFYEEFERVFNQNDSLSFFMFYHDTSTGESS